jgi:zinc finger protein
MAEATEQKGESEDNLNVVMGELCPICSKKGLSLTEREQEIPYFGNVLLFAMSCASCKFHKADVECLDVKDPMKYSIEVSGPEDMKIRVVKSSQATVKIPYIADIIPGPASNGFVSNVEGILQRVKHQVEATRDSEEDKSAVKKAKNIIKKINKVTWGEEKAKIIIEDPSGNSAIISDKATVSKMSKKT